MQFRVMQHNDHDWREPCEGQCEKTWRTVEADSAVEAVKLFFVTCPNVRDDNELVDIVKTADVKTLAEGVYMLDLGEAGDHWFAFRVELAQIIS
ncbi:hypothetical protein LCGC14_1345790 [marine sediment metagenome]|uniref:Uncharacterized protein n=1 Tax=marine sediment metagenome TaxID=412755 RepID=A0A0F9NES8_9ZZZZ